jgi:hypothetical protein
VTSFAPQAAVAGIMILRSAIGLHHRLALCGETVISPRPAAQCQLRSADCHGRLSRICGTAIECVLGVVGPPIGAPLEEDRI